MKALVLALGLLGLASSALAQSAACPLSSEPSAQLRDVSFFDGDAKDMVELAPDDDSADGRLDLTWQFSPVRAQPVTMICNYSAGESQRLQLPQTVSVCKLTGDMDPSGGVQGAAVLVCQ